MSKILILSRRDDRPTFDRTESMLAGMAAIRSSNEYVGVDYEDLLFVYDGNELRVTDGKTGVSIADFDAIFFIGWFKTKPLDDVARSVAHYARHMNIPFSNSEAYHGRSFSKLSQCVIAVINDALAVTPFVFSMNPDILQDAIKKNTFLGSKYILKAIAASRGNDNYLIQNHDQLKHVLAQVDDPQKFYIAQTFVPNDGDFRVIVAGGGVRLVMHRRAAGETHLNNTSQGGEATLVSVDLLPLSVQNGAIRMAELLRREITGVDVIQDRNSAAYYFLEANNMPQLSTGSFVETKMKMLDSYLGELCKGQTIRYID